VKYLLDSEVCVEIMRRRGPVSTRITRYSPDELAISTINLAELEYGVLRSGNPTEQRRRLDALLAAPIMLLPFDSAAARLQARVRLALRANPIGPHDLLAASIALAHDLIMVTRNVRELARVPGLAVEDWTA